MKKLLNRVIALLSLMAVAIVPAIAQQQQLPQLPADPAYRIGKLDNGMTYYIRHNEKPKGQANFYIAQRVGSVLEEENQRGLAHFLEHMCFNGTQHFKGNELIDWLEGKGVKFGHDLNAHTGFDETIYKIPNVPTADLGVQDTCLIILHDWADGLLLDPEEIDKERGVIHEEWRLSNQGQMRVLEKLLPKMMSGSRYGSRLPIGTMEVVDNFEPQALRDYYETWYRPDNQAIIVIGDIDVDYIEGKIKEIFSPIKMPENPKTRIYPDVPDNEGTIYAIGADPEITQTSVMLMFKNDQMIPREYRNTQAYYGVDYLENMINSMLHSRFSELNRNPANPFASAGASIGNFFVTDAKSMASIDVSPKGDNTIEASKAAYREFLRAAKGGFTVGELERAKAEYISALEKLYAERNNTQNAVYVEECVRNFIDNQPMPGIETDLQVMKQLSQFINIDQINQVFGSMVLDENGKVKQDNRVLLALFPEKEGVTIPSEEEFAKAFAEVEAEELEPYKDEMKSEPLIPSLPAPGKITDRKELKDYEATEYTLSNGIKVVVKSTKFKENEIVMNAISKTGYANIDTKQASNVKLLGGALYKARGLGEYTPSDLQKYMQGKQASINFSPSAYNSSISGNATVKDLPVMMELLYMTFKDLRICESDYTAMLESYKSMLENQMKDPQYIFGKTIYETIYESPMLKQLTVEDLENANAQESELIIKGLLKNPADYKFFFVGAIDLKTFEPLMEQYLATLPTDIKTAGKQTAYNKSFDIKPGKIDKVVTTKMETPQSRVFMAYSGKVPYTAKNKVAASAISQILSNRLLKKIREEMGATYSIGAGGALSRGEGQNFTIQIPSALKPELKEASIKAINEIIAAMPEDITEEELAPIKEYMIKTAIKGMEENREWSSTMAAETINNVPTFLNAKETIESVTVEDLKALLKNLMNQGNISDIIVDPAE